MVEEKRPYLVAEGKVTIRAPLFTDNLLSHSYESELPSMAT
jgi:hypothetical protein